MKLTTTQLFDLHRTLQGRLGDSAEAHIYFGDELGRPRNLIAWARDRYGIARELHIVLVDPMWGDSHDSSDTLNALMP